MNTPAFEIRTAGGFAGGQAAMLNREAFPDGEAHDDLGRLRTDECERVRRRHAQEVQALRDTIDVFRDGASVLAGRVSALRSEVSRLAGEVRAARVVRGVKNVEVTLALDEDAEDLVCAILVAELTGAVSARTLEDAQLVACELVAGSVHRQDGRSGTEGVLRIVHSDS